MRYNSRTLWAKPYIQDAWREFKSYRLVEVLPLHRGCTSDGICRRNSRGWFRVGIRLHRLHKTRMVSLEDALFFLAHELAHTLVWKDDHSPDRFMKAELDIMESFRCTAVRLGVTDITEEAVPTERTTGRRR